MGLQFFFQSYLARVTCAAILPGIFLLLSCGKLTYRAAYSQADILLLLRIQSYFDLNSSQRTAVRERLRSLHGWHRQNEMPGYAEFMREVSRESHNGITEKEIATAFGRAQSFYNRFWQRLIQAGSPVLANLSKEQIDHLEKKLAQSNKELEEHVALPPAMRIAKRKKKARENMIEWFGEISAVQGQRLDGIMSAFPDASDLYLRYSNQRKREFVALLRAKKKPSEIEATLLNWTVHREKNYPDYYKNASKNWISNFSTAAIQVDRMLTEEQRSHARKKLGEYIAFCDSQSARSAAVLLPNLRNHQITSGNAAALLLNPQGEALRALPVLPELSAAVLLY